MGNYSGLFGFIFQIYIMTNEEIMVALQIEDIEASRITYRNQTWIMLKFERDRKKEVAIRKINGWFWSNKEKAWLLPGNRKVLIIFLNLLGYKGIEGQLSGEIYVKVENFKQWMKSRRYSENTIKTYTDSLIQFLRYFWDKPISEICAEDVVRFNNEFIVKNRLSASFQNQVVNAIKLFFDKVEGSKMRIDLVHRPKRSHLLPNVLSKEEVKLILNASTNLKHRTMLSLIYSCGLRRSELLNLKPIDIDSNRNIIIIRQAKGKKDRIVPLSEKILKMLREYYALYKPKKWLFEGQIPGEQYDERSLSNVLKQCLEKAKINKPATLHWLRHSYATHLLEKGTDLRYIQELLGHKSSRTTEIYTHVSTQSIQKIISPFDDL
jgi:integrase/recombinase XerD